LNFILFRAEEVAKEFEAANEVLAENLDENLPESPKNLVIQFTKIFIFINEYVFCIEKNPKIFILFLVVVN